MFQPPIPPQLEGPTGAGGAGPIQLGLQLLGAQRHAGLMAGPGGLLPKSHGSMTDPCVDDRDSEMMPERPKPLTLSEAGIDKHLADKARKFAARTDEEFDGGGPGAPQSAPLATLPPILHLALCTQTNGHGYKGHEPTSQTPYPPPPYVRHPRGMGFIFPANRALATAQTLIRRFFCSKSSVFQ